MLLGRNTMTNIDSILKSKDIPLETKVHKIKATDFPCLSLSAGVCSNSCPLNWWCYLCHPLPPSSPFAFNLSQHQNLFQWVSSLHQVAKVCSFSFSISLSNEYSGLISVRIDWFDLFAGQGTLKSILQDHNLKTSVLQHSAFFMVQLSVYDYWKNHSFGHVDLCWQVMSLLFDMLSRFLIASLPRGKCLLISWLQS